MPRSPLFNDGPERFGIETSMRILNLSDVPIRRKLILITMITAAAALLLAGGGMVAFDYTLFRRALVRDLAVLARIAADDSAASLQSDDPGAAEETLAALKARSHLVKACIDRADGTVLAEYARPGAGRGCPSARSRDGVQFTVAGATVSQAIMLGKNTLGTFVLLYDTGEISERLAFYGGTMLGVLLVSSLLAFALSSKLREVIAHPIAELVHATTAVAESHDYSIRARRLSSDELGLLVDRFNGMLAGIESRDRTLKRALAEREEALTQTEQARTDAERAREEAERAEDRFRFMAESMPQKIFTARANGGTEYLNRQWQEFSGIPLDLLRRPQGWLRIIHPDDVDTWQRAWERSLRSGGLFRVGVLQGGARQAGVLRGGAFSIETRFRNAGGEYRWHLTRAVPMRDAQGNLSMWIGSVTEIQEQKEKEEDLRQANADLEQFAYSASHDLQEPIRNVAVYSEIVATRYRNALDSEGRQFLGFLGESGRRLATLVDDLLAYSRAGVTDNPPGTAPAMTAAQHALANLAQAVRESGAAVTCDPLPEVPMGEAHLQQVFQNLIGNALKYRGDNPPRIHIGVAPEGALWRFFVRDNGIGIDPQYKEKSFGVFKRLHHDRKYGGTGIGLAICQRVVERYGGRIWVESSLGEGATFHFTVPGAERCGGEQFRQSSADTVAG